MTTIKKIIKTKAQYLNRNRSPIGAQIFTGKTGKQYFLKITGKTGKNRYVMNKAYRN